MSTPRLNFTPIEKRVTEDLSRDLARFVRILDKIESHRPDGCQPPAAPNMRSLAEINRDLNSVDDYFRELAAEPIGETPAPNSNPATSPVKMARTARP